MADINLDKTQRVRMTVQQAVKIAVTFCSVCLGAATFWHSMEEVSGSVDVLSVDVKKANEKMTIFGQELVELSKRDLEMRQEIAQAALQADLKLERATEANFARIEQQMRSMEQRFHSVEADIAEIKRSP